MKLSLYTYGESRWEVASLGMNASVENRSVLASKENRCVVLPQRHSGVCGVGMLRNVTETNREILACVNESKDEITTTVTSVNRKSRTASKEVGGAHSNAEALVMRRGVKGLYLVKVNSEGKDV